jgi:hypothetical protein
LHIVIDDLGGVFSNIKHILTVSFSSSWSSDAEVHAWHRLGKETRGREGKAGASCNTSPQFDKPVKDGEDQEAEEQHVAQELGLASPGKLLHSPYGGPQQTSR